MKKATTEQLEGLKTDLAAGERKRLLIQLLMDADQANHDHQPITVRRKLDLALKMLGARR
jgi:hypothetical protein